jgi:hypothetical protein
MPGINQEVVSIKSVEPLLFNEHIAIPATYLDQVFNYNGCLTIYVILGGGVHGFVRECRSPSGLSQGAELLIANVSSENCGGA